MNKDTKTVLVTGSGTGIGQAVARKFAKEGFNIIILGRRKEPLVEALALELVERDIKSIGTNPGPVHSDRIYKTVYPKAAAEFLRIGGFKGLTNKQIEIANATLLPYLGENKDILEQEAKKTADAI